jgi:hypothetical protein
MRVLTLASSRSVDIRYGDTNVAAAAPSMTRSDASRARRVAVAACGDSQL